MPSTARRVTSPTGRLKSRQKPRKQESSPPPPHAFEKGLTRRVGTAWHGTLHLAQVSSLPFPLDVLHILSVSQGTTIKEAHILGFRTE